MLFGNTVKSSSKSKSGPPLDYEIRQQASTASSVVPGILETQMNLVSTDQVAKARCRLRAAQRRIINLKQRASTLVCQKVDVGTKLHDMRSKCAELLQQKRDAQRDLCIQSNRRDTLRRFYADQRRQMETFDKKEAQSWQDEEAIVYSLSETVTKLTIEHEELTNAAMTFSENTNVANSEAEIGERQAIMQSLEQQIMIQREGCSKLSVEAEEARKYQEARKEEVTSLLRTRTEQMQALNKESQRLEAHVMEAMRKRDEKRRELQQLEESSNKAQKGKRGSRSKR